MPVKEQINSILDTLPQTEQIFCLEVIKRVANGNNQPKNTTEITPEFLENQKRAVKRFLSAVNTHPLPDDELDDMLNHRINITRDLGDLE